MDCMVSNLGSGVSPLLIFANVLRGILLIFANSSQVYPRSLQIFLIFSLFNISALPYLVFLYILRELTLIAALPYNLPYAVSQGCTETAKNKMEEHYNGNENSANRIFG